MPFEELVTGRGHYSASRERKFAGTYPIVEGYKGEVSPGWFFHWEDPLQFNQINASVSVSPFGHMDTGERFHARLQLKTLNWDIKLQHNGADFYDLFGPIYRSLRGNSVIAAYDKTVIYDLPRQLDLFGSAAVYTGLDTLPNAQNIASPKNIGSLEVGAKYTNTRKSLGSVDHEKGVAWRALADVDYAQGHAFPKLYGGVDYGVPLPFANSSAWVYASGGVAEGERSSPWQPSTSARSATTTSMTGPRNAIARWRASPASRSTRSPPGASPS